ncbi:MAG: hypothetical protein ACR2LZ_03980 [Pyrinomonadaceae bacterium]
MICIEPGLYVVIEEAEHERAPQPFPLTNGFSHSYAYRVLGVYSASETSEAYFILSNDRNEIWFISNRHLRTYKILPHSSQLTIALPVRETPLREIRSASGQDVA